jgi:hypothetical protein
MFRAIVFSFTLMISLGAGAQVAPAMINHQNSPLWITSITSTMTDMLQTVEVKNVSDRPIRSYQLGLIMTVPAACGPREVVGPERLMQLDRVSVPVGAKAKSVDYRLAPKEIEQFGFQNVGRSVHSQIAVVHVEFDDGGSWTIESHPHEPYDRQIMIGDGELACSYSSKAVLERAAVLKRCSNSRVLSLLGPEDGGQTYSCAASTTNEQCAVGEGGQSCTSSFCNGGCAYQTCKAGVSHPPPVQN